MRFEFRLLRRSDFDLLGRWLADPVVHRWWYHESTPDAIERDFGPAVDGRDPTVMNLVLAADEQASAARPIGLIQSYALSDHPEYVDELSAVMVVPVDAGSIDYLIGEAELRGRGVGRALIAAYVERVWAMHPSIGSLIVPVTAANVGSWKALLGAGFSKLGVGDLQPDNPVDDPLHVIMGLDRPRE